MFSAMSYGSISYNAHKKFGYGRRRTWYFYIIPVKAAFMRIFYQYGSNTIVQVASGRFGVHEDYLKIAAPL